MIVARSLLFLVFQLVVTPPYAIAVLFTFPFPRLIRFRFISGWCRLILGAARIICGIGHQFKGTENIGPGPYVVLSKHSSTWETLALAFLLAPTAYVAKQELLWIPFFGWGFALGSPITIDRKEGPAAMQHIALQAAERLKQGFWITLFPEGTRIPAGLRGKYKTGGARLAAMLDIPILPVAHNAGYLWPKHGQLKYPGTITISIGAPIEPAGRTPTELIAQVETWIEDEVACLGNPRAKG